MGKLLVGRVAVVTGASRGIGRGIAERLAAEGATVVIAARSVEQSSDLPGTLREVTQLIESRGGRAVCIRCDVTDPESRAALIDETVDRLGRLDILVNNAGRSIHRVLVDMSLDDIEGQIAEYLIAPVDLSRLAIPQMQKQGEGWILNIGSATVQMPEPPYNSFQTEGGSNLYGALKMALHRLSAGLAAELYASNIAVNVVAPVGAIVTPGYASHGTVERDAAYLEPMEHLVEAAVALVSAPPQQCTGKIAFSYKYLDQIGRSTRSLDGSHILVERPIWSRYL